MLEFTHHDAHRLIQTALDESLSPQDQAGLTEHLGRCPDCRLYADELRHLQVTLRQVAEQHRRQARAVPDLSDRVRRRLNGGQARRWWLGLGSGLAQTGSLMVLALLVLRLGHLSALAPLRPAADSAAPAAPAGVSLPAALQREQWLPAADLVTSTGQLEFIPLEWGLDYGAEALFPGMNLRLAIPQ